MLDDCAPERDGNADGISGPSEAPRDKEEPHTGEMGICKVICKERTALYSKFGGSLG